MTAQSTQFKKSTLSETSKSKGFTLIELLVTIAIIAIISVVAVALFGNIQMDARDGKRKAELESIANALELAKTSAGYQLIQNTQFGGSLIPGNTSAATATNFRWAIDPQTIPYCINTTGAADAATSPWAANANPTAAGGTCPANYAAIQHATTPAANSTQYKICTLLENRGTLTSFCRTNTQ